jgi:hypothetical protein
MEPDAIIEVRFKTTEENGRKAGVSRSHFGCPFILDGEAFDCRLLLLGKRLELRKTYTVPLKVEVLEPDARFVQSCRREGVRPVGRWDGKLAEGSYPEAAADADLQIGKADSNVQRKHRKGYPLDSGSGST